MKIRIASQIPADESKEVKLQLLQDGDAVMVRDTVTGYVLLSISPTGIFRFAGFDGRGFPVDYKGRISLTNE